jgi:tRNA A-37 threonylcarbamoyl transferase component Bud32
MKLTKFTTQAELACLTHEDTQQFLLAVGDKELFCQRVLRLIPGKRCVIEGLYDDKKVIAKIFFDQKRSWDHWHRELAGYQQLGEEKFKTPQLFFTGKLEIENVYVAIFQELYPARRLTQVIADTNEEKVKQALLAVQQEIASLHNSGLLQTDPHPDNFLLVGEDIYVIDYAGITRSKEPQQLLQNLGLFYAQLPVSMRFDFSELLCAYAELRDFQVTAATIKQVKSYARAARWKRATIIMEKCLRQSTQFEASSGMKKACAYFRAEIDEDLSLFINDPEIFLQQHEAAILKDGGTCTVFKTKLGEREVVVKRYNIKDFKHWLTHCWRRSRAMKSWVNANLLTMFAVPTARPIAYVEKKICWLRLQTYFVMEYVESEDLTDKFITEIDDELVDHVARLIGDVAALQIAHGDFKAANFVVTKLKEVLLIDLDSLKVFKSRIKWRAAFKKDKIRFRRNWFKYPKLLKAFDIALGKYLQGKE